jgi:5-methylthioribose kinase
MKGLFMSAQDEAALEAERRRFLRSLFQDTLGFGGLKMIRRILRLAQVPWKASPIRRDATYERKALRLAHTLVVQGVKFSGIAEVVEVAKRHALPLG